jgi:hypothetical protein
VVTKYTWVTGLCALAMLAFAREVPAGDRASTTSAGPPPPARVEHIRARYEREVRLHYEDARGEIGLSAQEHERLVHLLVDQRMRAGVRIVGRKPAGSPTADDTRARIETEFGPRRAVLFDEYERTVHVRQEVESLRATLESAGLPISQTQRTELIRAGIAADKGSTEVAITRHDSLADRNRKLLTFIEERDRRFLPVVRRVLSAPQVARYEAFVAERRAQVEGMRSPPRKSAPPDSR